MKKSKKTGFQRQALVFLFLGALIVNTPLTLFLFSWGFASYGLVVFFLRKVFSFFRRNKHHIDPHGTPSSPGN